MGTAISVFTILSFSRWCWLPQMQLDPRINEDLSILLLNPTLPHSLVPEPWFLKSRWKDIEIYRSFHLKLDSGVSCQSRIADSRWDGMINRNIRFSAHRIGFYKNVAMLYIGIIWFLLLLGNTAIMIHFETWEHWNLELLLTIKIDLWFGSY